MSMLREPLDELTEQLGPPDEGLVAEAFGTDRARTRVRTAELSEQQRAVHPEAPVLAVLDSEALAALAFRRERGRAGRRAQAVLVAVERLGGRACVSAPVIAEVARSASRRTGVDRVLRQLPVVDTDRPVATLAGHLMSRTGSTCATR
jgi:hypothetical protein